MNQNVTSNQINVFKNIDIGSIKYGHITVLHDLIFHVINGKGTIKFKKYFTNVYHYKLFVKEVYRRRKYIYAIYIVLTRRQVYAVLRMSKKLSNNLNEEHDYLIGWDSDKLFLSEINRFDIPLDFERLNEYEVGGVKIIIAKSYNYFYEENLGYDFDINDIGDYVEELVIDSKGRYRVQGDLVLEVGEFTYDLSGSLAQELGDIAERLIAERIQTILSGFGISSTQNNNTIEIENLRWRRWLVDKLLIKMFDVLRIDDIIERLTNVKVSTYRQSLGWYAENEKSYIIYIYDNNDKIAEIFAVMTKRRYGVQRLMIIVSVNRYAIIRLLLRDESILHNVIKDVKTTNITINMGNHNIYIRDALPPSMTVIVSYDENNTLRHNITLSIGTREIYVTPQSLIIIRHPEHGEIRVRVTKEMAIRFDNTNITNEFRRKLNNIIIKEL